MAKKVGRMRPHQVITATSLPQVSDGYVGRILDKALSDIYADLENRGRNDLINRELHMKMIFIPGQDGRVKIRTQVKTKLPAYQPEDTIAKLDKDTGGMLFSPDCSENPDQLTFAGEVDEDTGEIKAPQQ